MVHLGMVMLWLPGFADAASRFEDEDPAAADKTGDLPVRRLPVLNRDKRPVGAISRGDIAQKGEGRAGAALSGISEQGGRESPAMHGPTGAA